MIYNKRRFQKFLLLVGIVVLIACSCKPDSSKKDLAKLSLKTPRDTVRPMDTTKIESFFLKYPEFSTHKLNVTQLYQKYNRFIWFKNNGLTEFAQVLFNQVVQLDNEGIKTPVPYRHQYDEIFYTEKGNLATITSELLISCLYFYYIKNVYEGIDTEISENLQWHLPREKVSYASLLDTLMLKPDLIGKERPAFFGQYYNLRKALWQFKQIEKKGGWKSIAFSPEMLPFKKGDTSATVASVRSRLFKEGYIANDSGELIFDNELIDGILKYQRRHNRTSDSLITKSLISELNIPVAERIKTISVNMERCRWITPNLIKAKEFIAVNIPSYRLHYIQNGKPVLISKVVVGRELNKTVVFSGEMSYIVFNPYWNVPNSILKNEIVPEMHKDPNYLSKHNMEWHEGRLRQKPSKNNSLGLVKFMFPNSNNIYLHDTPAKSLFNQEQRAFSHGCIRVEKARELAIAILGTDSDEKKIDRLMDGSEEKVVKLKEKIPVYIAYFTAWADEDGNIAFFKDIYNRDTELAQLLHL